MSNRKVHLRTAGVIQPGHTKTYCGRVIYGAPQDTTGAVVTFNHNLEATVHGTRRHLRILPRGNSPSARSRMICSGCGKPMSRKTARLINGKLLCSACLFPPLKKGVPQQ